MQPHPLLKTKRKEEPPQYDPIGIISETVNPNAAFFKCTRNGLTERMTGAADKSPMQRPQSAKWVGAFASGIIQIAYFRRFFR
jgi:hypothetical protein